MQTKIGQKQRFYRIASMIATFLGTILLAYMIIVEDEMGAIPLLLLAIGIALFIISKINFKNNKI